MLGDKKRKNENFRDLMIDIGAGICYTRTVDHKKEETVR